MNKNWNAPQWAKGMLGQMGMRSEVMAIWTRQDLGENERLEEIFQAGERAGRSSMQEQCMKAVCYGCEKGLPLDHQCHRSPEGGIMACYAAAIRALKVDG